MSQPRECQRAKREREREKTNLWIVPIECGIRIRLLGLAAACRWFGEFGVPALNSAIIAHLALLNHAGHDGECGTWEIREVGVGISPGSHVQMPTEAGFAARSFVILLRLL